MPDVLEIEDIASNTPQRTVTLSGISATVLFSVLNAGFKITDWWAGDQPLDQTQKDQVYAWLALANKELMMTIVGQIFAYAGSSAPPGSLPCDGGTYDRATYPALYAALDPAFVVDADHFTVPDLRSNFIRGASATFHIADSGGEETVTLTGSQIPSHAHTIPSTVTTAAVEPGEVAVLSPVPIVPSYTGDFGGDGSHNNIPPFVALLYCIVAV